MTSNSDDIGAAFPANLTLSQMVSLVPPVPAAVVKIVERTPLGQLYASWPTAYGSRPYAQIITALVLLERSPAGRAWKVQLAAIPSGTIPGDTRYNAPGTVGLPYNEIMGCVEWFYKRSGVGETAPMATVAWANSTQDAFVRNNWGGLLYSCNALCRMLYAAQAFQESPNIDISERLGAMERKIERLDAMEQKIEDLEARIAVLSVCQPRVPTVTCLMHLFAVDTLSTTCNSSDTDPDSGEPRNPGESKSNKRPGGGSSASAGESNAPFCPRLVHFNIGPHTDRLCDLSTEAQSWFLHQLDTRTVWVRVTDPDSEDNHISWVKFPGAVEMGKGVVFSHGNYRFW